jgi:hypothetical protein
VKPLELTIYPEVDRWVTTEHGGHRESGYETPTGVYDFTFFGPDLFDKRLTDPELAAELHQATLDIYRAKVHFEGDRAALRSEAIGRMQTVLRFAMAPHFDEEPEP